MDFEYLEQPCRNYCFFKGILLNDPKDGKEKVVLSSFVAGGTGEIVFIDPETGEGETLVIPGDNGAWALYNYKDEKLLVGTCGTYGYLHCLELANREWKPSLRVDGISYIWDLDLGSDGKVYGGTYPGCVLLQYDPDLHTLTNLGPMTKDEGNLYSRLVFAPVPGKVYVNCGMSSTCIGVYDIKNNEMSTVMEGCSIQKATKDYLYLNTPKGSVLVDPVTFEEINNDTYQKEVTEKDSRLPTPSGHVMTLKNGNKIGVCGQRYFILKPDSKEPEFNKIPGNPPPTEIFAMTCDDNGILWGTTGLGQTMFSYDPVTGQYWNSDIVTERGGEVYGIVSYEGKIYMTSYAGGDHMIYDPSKEWNQYENVNPYTLDRIGPSYIRPQARSFLGPDNNVWTGWIAAYGSYGCAISEINTKTNGVRNFTDLVPGQGIGSIAGDSQNIFFTTNGSGNGLKTKAEEFYLVKMNKNGEILNKIKFPLGVHLSCVYFINGKVFLYTMDGRESKLYIYDADTMQEKEAVCLNYMVQRIIDMKDGNLLYNVRKRVDDKPAHALLVINPANMEIIKEIILPGHTSSFCHNDKDDYIYFAHRSKLYRVKYQ